MINCYIIENEPQTLNALSTYINGANSLKLVGYNNNPLGALKEINELSIVDLIFCDIDTPDVSGLEIADLLSGFLKIVFTSINPKYAVDAFELSAVDFLLKPISSKRFNKSLEKIEKLSHLNQISDNTQSIYKNTGVKGKIIHIVLSEIQFIQGLKNYIVIYMDNGDKHITYMSMTKLENVLPQKRFCRVHKSYMLNIDKIVLVEGNRIKLFKNIYLPIGLSYKGKFTSLISAMILNGRS